MVQVSLKGAVGTCEKARTLELSTEERKDLLTVAVLLRGTLEVGLKVQHKEKE